MTSEDVVIFGTGGFAREVHQIIIDLNLDGRRFNLLGFLDEDQSKHGSDIHGLEVFGNEQWLKNRKSVGVIIGIGNTTAKKHVVERLNDSGLFSFPVLIHPRAWIGRGIDIGQGTVICCGARATTDIRIGAFSTLNLNCTIGHDAILGDYSTVAPSANVSGNVLVGEGCDLGTGCSIIQGVKIGAWTIIGAGAVVVRDLPVRVVATGVPARVTRSLDE